MPTIDQALGGRVGDWILDRDDGQASWCHRASAPEVRGRIEVRRLGLVSMAKIEREVAVLGACRHPGIPRVLDVGVDRSRRVGWRVVEARCDHTLADRLLEGPLPWEEACRRFLHLADGLAYLHRAGLVHGRIEPAEIGLCRDGRTSFTGLGSVRARTAAGALVDVYAFGRSLFEALTAGSGLPARVYAGADNAPAFTAIQLDPGPAHPRWLRDVVRWATAADPTSRAPDADALLGALELRASAFAEVAGSAPTDPYPPPRMSAPRPRLAPAPAAAEGPWWGAVGRAVDWGRSALLG